MSKLDIQATRELCEKAPRRIAMIETGNSHLGYGCSDEEVSCESEHFYDSAIVALPLALDRVEELERECERLRGLVEEAASMLDGYITHRANVLDHVSQNPADETIAAECALALQAVHDDDATVFRIREATTARIAESKKGSGQ
jgi:hypothetical protein